jgi:predicted nucleotidyltransferase
MSILLERMADLLQHVADSGFDHLDDLIHLFVGGSELHGAKVHGTDDLDIYGLYIEPPELVLGLESMPHFVWSTAGNERRNGSADIDITLYSLKKWAGLACKGNPTALHFLFTKSAVHSPIWREVLAKRKAFLSKSCVPQFLGFADAQLKRMTGKLGRGKKGQRPELEEKYGYDVKAGMHVIRLLHECQELVTEGKITLPRPEKDLLIRVRTGKYSMDKVMAMAQRLFAECEEAARTSPLPEKTDRVAVSQLLASAYRSAWDRGARSNV